MSGAVSATLEPGRWYTAPVGTPAPAPTVGQVGDTSRFVDPWPQEWALTADGLGARLLVVDGTPFLRLGRTLPARQVLNAAAVEPVALGYESGDFTVRAVFRGATHDNSITHLPYGDILIAGWPHGFRVYTAGVVHGVATGFARRIVER